MCKQRIQRSVAVALEHRFYEYAGVIYTKMNHDYRYWQRYLESFDHVTVIARSKKVDEYDTKFLKVTGPNVDFVSLPYYVGPQSFLKCFPALVRQSLVVALNHRRFILRSGNISNTLWLFLLLLRRPYLREYPGIVKEGVLGFTGATSLFMYSLASLLDNIAKIQGCLSKANSYVSDACARHYSTRWNKNNFVFSSFSLQDISCCKEDYSISQAFKVCSVGRLENEKGYNQLIESLTDLNAHLTLIGDGSRRRELESLALTCRVKVDFTGVITDQRQLHRKVADCDLFVLPSLTEGMPRALLEAMAIGMCCIATRVGGIPEVLPEECLVPVNSPAQLRQRIREIASNESDRKRIGKALRDVVRTRYATDVQNDKMNAFWNCL